jgi:arsenate reductase (glutaredoxin)
MSAPMPVMYGIANCDTIKKARRWLTQNNIEVEFHDYKKLGTQQDQLQRWVQHFGWEQLINRRGTTWRKLDQATRDSMDDSRAIAVMQENPSIIKRPLLEIGDEYILGFNEQQYKQALLSS